MFNAEKLLGTILKEVVGSGNSYGKIGKKKKKRKDGNPLVDSLKSGSGLLTAIGLGIGAYEILRQKSQPSGHQPPMPGAPPIQPGPSAASPAMPPPVPPPMPKPAAGAPAPAATSQHNASGEGQELALRMIQVMIAAAHPDGTMDEAEEQAVLTRLKAAELGQEERMFLLTELHTPRSLAELTQDIDDPSLAQAMYMMAANAVDIDTEAERRWFDELASRLGLSKAVQQFIEEQS